MANEVRFRRNLMRGILNTSISNVATSTTAFSSHALPAIYDAAGGGPSGNNFMHMAITLGPTSPSPEIIYVTEVTIGSGTFAILRGKELTTAQTWPAGTEWVLAPTVRDYPQTTTFRPAIAADNSNPTFASTAGVWTSLPHTTVSTLLFPGGSSNCFTGDTIEVWGSLLAKVTSGATKLSLDVQLSNFVSTWQVGIELGAEGLVYTHSTTYQFLQFQGATQAPSDSAGNTLSGEILYLADGAGTFGCNAASPDTNVDVWLGWRVSCPAVFGNTP